MASGGTIVCYTEHIHTCFLYDGCRDSFNSAMWTMDPAFFGCCHKIYIRFPGQSWGLCDAAFAGKFVQPDSASGGYVSQHGTSGIISGNAGTGPVVVYPCKSQKSRDLSGWHSDPVWCRFLRNASGYHVDVSYGKYGSMAALHRLSGGARVSGVGIVSLFWNCRYNLNNMLYRCPEKISDPGINTHIMKILYVSKIPYIYPKTASFYNEFIKSIQQK